MLVNVINNSCLRAMIPISTKLGKSSSRMERLTINCFINILIARMHISLATIISDTTHLGKSNSHVECPHISPPNGGVSSLFCAKATAGVMSPHILLKWRQRPRTFAEKQARTWSVLTFFSAFSSCVKRPPKR